MHKSAANRCFAPFQLQVHVAACRCLALLLHHHAVICVSGPNMATANVTLENQLHSAQKNLLFLQQDHASTLKGLHAEIRRLQQQCTGERARLPERRCSLRWPADALLLLFW